MANINENFNLRAPQPVDRRLGKWESGAWAPFDSREEALTAVEYYRYETLTLPVMEDNEVVEYWFIGGVTDSNFVLKTAQVDLSQFYTKTDLQTPGDAPVAWGNIVGAPATSSLLVGTDPVINWNATAVDSEGNPVSDTWMQLYGNTPSIQVWLEVSANNYSLEAVPVTMTLSGGNIQTVNIDTSGISARIIIK